MVFLTFLLCAIRHDMILVSEFSVTEIKASIDERSSSSNNSALLPSALITKAFGSKSAISKAFFLFFSIKVTLNFFSHNSRAVLYPIRPPPKIIIFLIEAFVFPVNLYNSSTPSFRVIKKAVSPSSKQVSPLGIIVFCVPLR